jgi:hypothetical protein
MTRSRRWSRTPRPMPKPTRPARSWWRPATRAKACCTRPRSRLSEHGDKVDPSTVEAIELAMGPLEDALKGEDAGKIKGAIQNLTEAAMKLGEAIYKASQAEGGDAGRRAAAGGRRRHRRCRLRGSGREQAEVSPREPERGAVWQRAAPLRFQGGFAVAKRDYYEVLGAQKGASADEMKKAYRTKAKELHPTATPTIRRPRPSSRK